MRRFTAGGLTLAVLWLAAACGGGGTPSAQGSGEPTPSGAGTSFVAANPTSPADRGGPTLPVQPDVVPLLERTLSQRADALLAHDREQFLAGVDSRDDGYFTAQAGYFDNLAQLPIAALRYHLYRETMVRDHQGYVVVVGVEMQLAGFDAAAVSTARHMRFEKRRGRWVISSVRDPQWESANDIRLEPWDLVPIQVRTAPGALLVFDDASVREAGPLMRAVRSSIDDVRARVPASAGEWNGSVVLYALSDASYLDSFDHLPGGDPGHLDGVAFGVMADGDPPTRAATRVAMSPFAWGQRTELRNRLLRHELTHVALGGHDESAPVWLAEGLAEWVSVQALAPEQRDVDVDGLAAAQRPGVVMPASDTFNDQDASAHYALAWWAVEYIAATYGDRVPWALLAAFQNAPDTAAGAVLQQTLGLSENQLARRGAHLMVNTYVTPTTTPTPTPTEASPTR